MNRLSPVQITQPGIQELRRILLKQAGLPTRPHVEPEASERPGGT